MERDHSVFNHDFLDSIDKDYPNGSWAVQKDPTGTIVTLRNLLWPGSYSFHRANTPLYGSVYFGDGISF